VKIAARAFVVWVIIMTLEVGNGILRKVFVELFFADVTARQIGVVVGSLMVILVAYGLSGWLKSRRRSTLVMIGLSWVVLTVAFEAFVGREVMGLSWARIWSHYDVHAGGLMPFGLAVMALAPLMGSWLRRRLRARKRRKRLLRPAPAPSAGQQAGQVRDGA
jgi:hypothetical protein